MNLPIKTEEDEKTHGNDTNTFSSHIVNASFLEKCLIKPI